MNSSQSMSNSSTPVGAKSTYGAQPGKTRSQTTEITRQLKLISEGLEEEGEEEEEEEEEEETDKQGDEESAEHEEESEDTSKSGGKRRRLLSEPSGAKSAGRSGTKSAAAGRTGTKSVVGGPPGTKAAAIAKAAATAAAAAAAGLAPVTTPASLFGPEPLPILDWLAAQPAEAPASIPSAGVAVAPAPPSEADDGWLNGWNLGNCLAPVLNRKCRKLFDNNKHKTSDTFAWALGNQTFESCVFFDGPASVLKHRNKESCASRLPAVWVETEAGRSRYWQRVLTTTLEGGATTTTKVEHMRSGVDYCTFKFPALASRTNLVNFSYHPGSAVAGQHWYLDAAGHVGSVTAADCADLLHGELDACIYNFILRKEEKAIELQLQEE
ncbi:hypothetical protein B484DRAFT_398212 [Ochromonadaceae sp. CCMP2298]|nr:hypothetical protein B484DRAFT_398212 [Ochromonadaceae sp. CCMP2298]